jgi:hypothetical protein
MGLLAAVALGSVGCTCGMATLDGGCREFAGRRAVSAPVPVAEVSRPLAAAKGVRSRNTGWRMGVLYVDGDLADWLKESHGAGRWLSVWGYQFDIERGLPDDRVKTVVAIIPSLAGLDKSMIIPNVNVLVGLRFWNADNTRGFEFGAGPHYAPRVYDAKKPGGEDWYPSDDIHLWGLGFTFGVGYTFVANAGLDNEMRVPIGLAGGFAGDGVIWSLTIGWNMKEW